MKETVRLTKPLHAISMGPSQVDAVEAIDPGKD